MPTTARSQALCLLLLSLLASTPVLAAGDERKVEAKAHYDRGSNLYRHGDYREAIAEFEAAYQARPHGVLFFNLAQCYEKLGELHLAQKNYEEYLRTTPDAEDHATVVVAIANLERRMKGETVAKPEAGPRVGDVPVVVATQPLKVTTAPAGAALTLDGVERGKTPSELLVAAGPHKLELSLDGYQALRREVVVPVDGPLALNLTLESTRKGRFFTWVALGAAGLLLASGGGVGLAARSASEELRSSVHERPQVQTLRDSAQSRSRVANVLFGVGGAALLAGGALFFLEGSF